MTKVTTDPLSQPSDSDWKGKPNPAKEFKKDAEARNANVQPADTKDRVEFSAFGGRLFSFKGEGDWLDRWGGLIMLLTAVAILALGFYVAYLKVGR